MFFLPLILVHLAYRIPAISPWFASIWEAGELITYIAGFEAFLGTVALGGATVYLNAKANSLSCSLIEIEKKRIKLERQPVIFTYIIHASVTHISNVFFDRRGFKKITYLEKSSNDFNKIDQSKLVIIFTLELMNEGKIPLHVDFDEMKIKNSANAEVKKIILVKHDDLVPKGLLLPNDTIILDFALKQDDFYKSDEYEITLSLVLKNIVNEVHKCVISLFCVFCNTYEIKLNVFDMTVFTEN